MKTKTKRTIKKEANLTEARLPTFRFISLLHSYSLTTYLSSNNTRTDKPVKKANISPKLICLFLFYTTLFSTLAFAQENNCSHLSFDKRAVVTQVYDGDTVRLSNGEKIRLIGINTPEMNYDTGSPEPYAKKAKRFLEKRVLKKRVGIKYGKEKRDRYKRRLGHLFLLDGTNLQYEMLKAGLAFNVTFPPNLWKNNCYKQAANQAQQNKLKIWKSPYYRSISATRVNKSKLGFRRITGKVKDVLTTKKTVWVQFSDKMALRISKKDLHYFKNLRPKNLIGKKVSASGWISFYKHRFSMKVRHPNALTIH